MNRLYYEDSHLSRFTAQVLSCQQSDKGFEVILDATAFYPEGGGQAGDTGTLSTARVLDTRERGEQVVHLCDSPLEIGSSVTGQIDYEPRFVRMQQHSGEHIVSGILHRRFGCSNTGFHMGQSRTVIDFDAPIPPEALPDIEQEANTAVWQNLPVKCWYPSPQELSRLDYRTKKALAWPVRIVEVPGFDRCACCGTHVTNTGEIGVIKLFSAIPFRGGTRMEMCCGIPALAALNEVYRQAVAVSHVFSSPVDRVGDAAEAFAAQLAAQKYRVTELERKLFAAAASAYAGRGNVLHFEPGLDSTGVRELADAIAEQCRGVAAVFSGDDAQGYGFCLVTRQGDLRPLGKAMTAALQGRGGGKALFQQGRVAGGKEQIQRFFAENL